MPGQDGHLFEIVGDQLWLASTPLDYEYMNTRTLTVRATDSEGATYDETLSIDVVNQTIEYLTTADDSNAATFEDTTFVGDVTTLNPGDSLMGSDWSNDSLRLLGYGVYDLSGLAAFSDIENVTVDTTEQDLASPDGGYIGLIMPDLAGMIMHLEFVTIGDTETWVNGVQTSNFYTATGGSGSDAWSSCRDWCKHLPGWRGSSLFGVSRADPWRATIPGRRPDLPGWLSLPTNP